MPKKIAIALVCSLALGLVATTSRAADDDDKKPKYKTKQIMKVAFKGTLLKKVASGDASEEDTKKLYEMLVALSENKPPRGEADTWKKLTGELVKAGKAAVDGKKEAGGMLKKAANCKACHSKHKPS
ncbi:MAG: hypothetical protein AAGA03_03355 [Planctomycetota bacterium]